MSVQLKRSMGEAGALLDDSQGFANLYDILANLTDAVNSLTAQFNQFVTDYNTGTPVHPTTAAAVSTYVTKE